VEDKTKHPFDKLLVLICKSDIWHTHNISCRSISKRSAEVSVRASGTTGATPIKAVAEDTKIRFLTHEANIQAWIVRRSN